MDEKQREILNRIVKKAEYLEALTSQYLNLARFESSMMESSPSLVDFMEDIVEPVDRAADAADRGARDEARAGLPVGNHSRSGAIPTLVKIVMINLLGNGIKYGNKGGVLRISVTKGFKKFSFSVWNEGPGFSRGG